MTGVQKFTTNTTEDRELREAVEKLPSRKMLNYYATSNARIPEALLLDALRICALLKSLPASSDSVPVGDGGEREALLSALIAATDPFVDTAFTRWQRASKSGIDLDGLTVFCEIPGLSVKVEITLGDLRKISEARSALTRARKDGSR